MDFSKFEMLINTAIETASDPTILNGIITSILAIAASLLTLTLSSIINARSQRAQFRHATELAREQNQHLERQNNNSRLSQLRQEVYLKAASALHEANAVIAALPHGKRVGELSSSMNPFFQVLSQARLVSETNTGTIIQQLLDEVGSTFVWMVQQSAELESLQEGATDARQALAAAKDQLMSDAVLSELSNDVADYSERYRIRYREVMEEFMKRHRATIGTYVRVMAAVRLELGIQTDLDKLEEESRKSAEIAFGRLQEIIAGV